MEQLRKRGFVRGRELKRLCLLSRPSNSYANCYGGPGKRGRKSFSRSTQSGWNYAVKFRSSCDK